jgi:hypothetical protein
MCTACSDTNVAKISANYALDLEETEQRALGFEGVSLMLASDGSFVLTGEFDGDERTYEGEWSLEGDQVEFSGGPEFGSASATVGHERLHVVGLTMLGNVHREFVRDEWPAWSLSIFAVVMLVFVALMYANKDSPNVTFSGGSPEFVVGMFIIICVPMFFLGIVGSFMPQVLVWAGEATDVLSMIEYLGFLGLVLIGILALASEEEGATRILWVVFGLGVVVMLVWLYFEYGVEISVSAG